MLRNITRRKILAREVRLCVSPWEKGRGLMFSKQREDCGLVFLFNDDAVRSLHMLFVFYPIDVLFLDANRRIVEMKEGFRPFHVYIPQAPSRYVVELNGGRVASSDTAVGDKVDW